MRILIEGFSRPINVEPGCVAELAIANHVLYARVVQSFLSGLGELAIEPYSLWDGNDQVKPRDAFFLITDPLNLPWDDRSMVTGLLKLIEARASEDEGSRLAVEELNQTIQSKLLEAGLALSSDYAFGIEWDLQKYLKAFGFGVDRSPDDRLLDSLIKFLSLTSDIGLKKPQLYVGLENFLSENELSLFCEQVFLSNRPALLLENRPSSISLSNLRKYYVDQDFLES